MALDLTPARYGAVANRTNDVTTGIVYSGKPGTNDSRLAGTTSVTD